LSLGHEHKRRDAVAGGVTWRIAGEEVGGCNCAWGCPCQFNALPTRGRCEGFGACEIRQGHFGSTRLEGVRFAGLYSWPGAIHDGNGTRQFVVDERASGEQRAAIEALESGEHGGAFFEIFASVCPNRFPTVVAAIEFSVDRNARVAAVRIPGVVENLIEPIRNPVSGEDHRARIVLPDGFEFTEAEVANSVVLRAGSESPLSFSHQNTYAQLNQFDWSNA
jgi:hypothetical protein